MAMTADDYVSLVRQLAVLRRRVASTVRELTEVMDGLPPLDELSCKAASEDSGRSLEHCDLYGDCIRLEVALDEASQSARKLARRAHAISNGQPMTTERVHRTLPVTCRSYGVRTSPRSA